MGGTGGGPIFVDIDQGKMDDRREESVRDARKDAYEADVGEYLTSLLAEYNDRDIEGTRDVLEAVKKELEGEIDGTVDLLFGGSVAKHTYVDGLSDVDMLVLFEKTELAGSSPGEIQKMLSRLLRDRFGRQATISAGKQAVTVSWEERTIQFLPALRIGDSFRIASSDGSGWTRTAPRRFAKALTSANRALGGTLIPCIKLVKAIVGALPESRQMSGYHTEAVAMKVLGSYDGPKTPKAMIRHYFEYAGRCVLSPIRDASGQSTFVDDYLGEKNDSRRRLIATTLDRIGRRLRNADSVTSLDQWKKLLDER